MNVLGWAFESNVGNILHVRPRGRGRSEVWRSKVKGHVWPLARALQHRSSGTAWVVYECQSLRYGRLIDHLIKYVNTRASYFDVGL